MPTKDELEDENARLREELEDARSGHAAAPRRPARPVGADGKPQLSAGEHFDLEQNGATVSPFTGEVLNAIDEGVTPLTAEAKKRAEDAHHKRGAFAEGATVSTATTGLQTPAEG